MSCLFILDGCTICMLLYPVVAAVLFVGEDGGGRALA